MNYFYQNNKNGFINYKNLKNIYCNIIKSPQDKIISNYLIGYKVNYFIIKKNKD